MPNVAKFGKGLLEELMKRFPESTARDIRSGLPMTDNRRMGRAVDQGFNTEQTMYHWTGSDIDEFIPSETGKYGRGIYMLDEPESGYKYAVEKGGDLNILPVYTRGNIADHNAVVDADRWVREHSDLVELKPNGMKKINGTRNDYWDAIGKRLQDQGFTGMNFQGETIVWNPKDVRSTQAAFSPNSINSGHLSAGVAGAGVLGGLLADYEEEERKRGLLDGL